MKDNFTSRAFQFKPDVESKTETQPFPIYCLKRNGSAQICWKPNIMGLGQQLQFTLAACHSVNLS